MSKIRINDLARELEVKSKAILDSLVVAGITEKKTHSSSLETDEAAKVRAYFKKQGEGNGASSKSAARSESDGIKTKIDLSNISRPGDVLKALIQKQGAPAAVPPRPAAAPPATAVPPVAEVRPVAKAPAPASASPAAPSPVATPPAPRFITPQAPGSRPTFTVPVKAPVAPASQAPAARVPEVVVTQPPVNIEAAAAPPVPPPTEAAAPAPPRFVAPPPRTIMPQTGPRPVYKAPAPPPVAAAPAGAPRPVPGRPVPGQPIFQRRPAPTGPGGAARPPLRPGERRPMHPTRTGAPGTRPPGMGGRPMGASGPGMGIAPGGAAPPGTRPGGRPTPPRRPGQRYIPKVQEGPMKGYTPPPRFTLPTEPMPITRTITITEGTSVKDLAEKLEIRAKDLIAGLLAKGVFATINQTLEADLASEMARFFGADTNVMSYEDQAAKEMEATLEGDDTHVGEITRPPVVTIMGHVDHGKTTLLDAIRATNVAEGEAGGITQHIGAYKVKVLDENSPAFGREIVFLDTPGHQAFTRMRARGAKVTDIVVLVVAADDGVMPQTIEAMDHAHAAEVPIIVAVNKIDKPDAMPDRVKKQLADRGLMPEDWGGTTVFVDVSAKKKTNLNLMMEMICLTADLQELKAVPTRPALGVVLEAKLDRGRGPVATVLVQNGTLRSTDNFVVGNAFGKVRAMFDDRGHQLETAGPSTPVEILGLESLPQAGDQFVVVADRDKARSISEYREQRAREATLAQSSRVSLEGLADQIKSAGIKELPVILKGDMQGSVEVLRDMLGKIASDKVRLKMIHSGVGAITETDILLASASNAVVIGFNVKPERKAQELADQEKVDIRLHSIIYELQDEIKRAMSGLLEPTYKETYLGRAEVKNVFRVPKAGTIAGCSVVDGLIRRDGEVRLMRGTALVHKGKIASLKRFKDDAMEVRSGVECGININYGDIKVGDTIECFSTETIAAEVIA
jgi:translation initiation factor IF-2